MPSTRQLTLRAVASGILLGALLTPCNIYSGLKIGWSFNVSIAALLLATGFWALLGKLRVATTLNRTEANLTQTGASSAANIVSGGLVAPIPALAMISGNNLSLQQLVPWVFAVSFFGIWVAWYLRGNLIVRAQLPFPTGRATAETLCEIFEHGREATLKLRVLMSATLIAGTAKWIDTGIMALPRPGLGLTLPATGKLAGMGPISAKNLTFSFDPSLMLAGFGAIIGLRNGVSLLLGGVLAWGILGPIGLAQGFIAPGSFDADASWFPNMIEWLLWPGVSLMVASALTRFLLQVADQSTSEIAPAERDSRRDRVLRLAGLVVGSGLVVIAQVMLFNISLPLAVITVPIAFLLAVVASRVVGETGIPPIGAIGKVSQLGTGISAPGDITANLIGANAAGGAAGQSADLLNDFKVGHVVGTPARLQVFAQAFGILTGSIVGSLVYLSLIPDPAAMLMTEEWPAPAVATWKVVAETLAGGFGNLPAGALAAASLFGLMGAAGAWLQHRYRPRWLPNMPALGLAMVVPASLSITMFLGSLIGAALTRYRFNLAQRFLIAAASGLIAGESLTGVARAMIGILG
jgi:uncharacterized oligopeptide transporter (OPT) family protein